MLIKYKITCIVNNFQSTSIYINFYNFQTPVSKESHVVEKGIPDVNPLSTMTWAKENNKEYDVFVFLGTNKMNFKNMNEAIKDYQAFLKKSVKYVSIENYTLIVLIQKSFLYY